jgi:hypothetical protein
MDEYYKWNRKDRLLYFISLIPFIAMLAMTLYIFSNHSIFISIIWISLYLLVNIFQSGCCVGCPYRGRYCPAFCGVYLGNILSGIIYKKRQFDPKFYNNNALAGEITLTVFLVFPIYWIFLANWYFVPVYIALIVAHIVLFMPQQCSKCSYNTVCPGGNAYQSYCRLFNKSKKQRK